MQTVCTSRDQPEGMTLAGIKQRKRSTQTAARTGNEYRH
jgi:hypothetical protein